MKYRIFETESEAAKASQAVYAELVRERAAIYDNVLEQWNGSIVVPVDLTGWPDETLTGDKFPIYGYRASDNKLMKQEGHTTAWAIPHQIIDGRWIFPSPDNQGVEADESWWPESSDTMSEGLLQEQNKIIEFLKLKKYGHTIV